MTIGCRGIPRHRSETCPARMPLKLNSLVRNSEQGLAWRSRGLVRHTISPCPDLGNQFELHDTKEGEQKKNTPRIPSFLGNEDLGGGDSRSLLTVTKRPPPNRARLRSSQAPPGSRQLSASNMGSAAALFAATLGLFPTRDTCSEARVKKPQAADASLQSSEYRGGQLVTVTPRNEHTAAK
jgi:hypothetical protein